MMPKLIALARRRTSPGMPSTGTPNISDAVIAWMSRPSLEGLLQLRDVGDVGEQAQLDLAVVGRDQHVARVGDEGRADLAAFLGADRDVLQVGIGRGEPAGGRGRQRIAGVDAAGVGVDVAGQRVGVGERQLGELAPVEHGVDQLARVLGQLLVGGQIVEQAGARLPLPGLGVLAAGQLQLVEQDLAELLGRAEVELVAGEAR